MATEFDVSHYIVKDLDDDSFELDGAVYNWLEEHIQGYYEIDLIERETKDGDVTNHSVIRIKDKSDAVLFKLTWIARAVDLQS